MAKTSKLLVAVVLILLASGILWFTKPWTAFTSSTIDEALPAATSVTNEGSKAQGVSSAPQPQTLAEGAFSPQAHATSGTAQILALDGQNVLRLSDFAVDNGPDLKVVVSESAEALNAGQYVSLGDLKATNGNQNYELPADFNPDTQRYVSIWCERFSVSFGAAQLS